MNARLTTNSLKQRLQLLLVALILSFLSFQPVAHAALNVDKHVNGGIEKARLALYAEPSALTVDSGKTKVRFSVKMTGNAKSVTKVILSRKGDIKSAVMNDQGKDGDLSAGDGIYSVSILLDASKLKPDACLKYEAIIKHGRSKAVSSPLSFCVNSFPVRIADSNTDKPAVLPDGTKVVADEIVITTKPKTKPDAIRRLAADINAKVVGGIPQLNLYQLKFASPPGAGRLAELVEKLNARPEVKAASASVIGTYTADPVPPLAEYNGLHGLKQIRAQDVWGAGASGAGVTVVVLDSGIDRTHPDFGTLGNCQMVDNDCGSASTDPLGHGTQVAGVVAAKSNGSGMVGVAYNSKIHSIQVGGGANPTLPQIAQAFLDAANYIHPSLCTTPTPGTPHPEATVINASLSSISAVGPSVDLSYLCRAINKAVLTETISGSCVYDGPAAAVVVNAAGNSNANDYYYPARCNVNEPAGTPHAATPTAKHNEELTRKDLFITVSNSVSSKTSDCLVNGAPNIAANQNGVNDRCEGNATVVPAIGGSNYGHWVDIAAPGSAIYTTTLVSAGSNATVTGTSFSAPMVSGAAAILASCGVPLGQIETALKTSAIVPVSYPAYTLPNPPYTPYPTGSTPRLDIYLALQAFLPAATNLNTAESYTEGIPLDLANIVVSSSIASCTTIAATLTLSDPNAGSLSSGGVNSNAAGMWTTSGTIASVNALLAGLTFNPNPNYSSDFTIATSVTDGISTINGSKVMTGIAVNSPPVNTIPAPQTATEDVVKVIGGISVVDADAGAMPITMTLTVTNGTISVNPAVAGGASVAGNGTASITLTGSQSQINTTLADAASVAYLPITNFNGAATLTVNTNDGGASGGPAQFDTDVINISVASVNDPPETLAGSGNGTEDVSPISVSLSGSDIDGTVASFNIVSGPSNGTLSVVGSVPAVGNAATVTYTPNPNFNGTDTFTYASVDNLGLADATAAIATITVIAVNDPPETAAGSGSGTEDVSPISVSLSGSDIDGTVASFNIVSGPSNGTLYSDAAMNLPLGGSVAAAGNTATVYYKPNSNFNGTDTFTFASVDNLGLADASAATATITVTPVNDPPAILGQPISFTHPEYNQVNPAASPVFDDYVGDVVASDPEGDALTFIITAGNEATVNGSTQSNAFRFDPAIPGRLLVDNRLAINFEYKPVFNLTVQVTDAGGLSASANVTVTLSNDANDNGDPHITTVRGLRYDFQSAGEFIALRGANGMEIQTRQTAIPGPAPFADPYSGLAVGVSINTAVAARVGANRVTYQPNADGVPELRINGNVTTLPANGVDLGVGGRVIPLGAHSIQVDFPDGTVMTVSAYLWGSLSYMQIGVMHTPAREGLMGINTAGSWLPRLADGTSFGAMPSALCDRFVELYEKFANSWRVTDGNSLFDYAPGTSTSTFTSAWPLEKPICATPSIVATPRPRAVAVAAPERRIAPVAPRGIVLKPVAKEVAQQQCRAIAGKTEKDNCVFDVMFTGNTGFAQAYQRTEKLRAGLTSVVLRVADKLNAQGEMVVVATVARHATVVPKVKGVRAVPAGAVQFMLGDKPLGKPVKLDAKGQAKLVVTRQNMERFNTGKLDISAQYQPVRDKANVFLPSISRKLTRELVRGR